MSEHTLCTTENSTPEVQQVSPNSEPSQERRPVFRPHVDLVDSPDAIILWANLPGADETSVDITLEKDSLTLKASVRHPQFDDMKPLLREYAVGDYERTFAISDEINREEIEASVAHGILKLVLPKTKHAVMRKVAVKAG